MPCSLPQFNTIASLNSCGSMDNTVQLSSANLDCPLNFNSSFNNSLSALSLSSCTCCCCKAMTCDCKLVFSLTTERSEPIVEKKVCTGSATLRTKLEIGRGACSN